MRWLQQQKGVAVGGYTLCCAAEYGHIALCKYLHDEVGIEWSESVTAAAAKGCETEVVSWLVAQGCPAARMLMCISAAEAGCIELMAEYLQQVRQSDHTAEAQQQLLTDMLHAAGAHCRLEAAQWARHRAELNYEAVQAWHGATLEWARAECCTSPLRYHRDSDSDEYHSDHDEYGYDSDNLSDDDGYNGMLALLVQI
jgi:hypothetical protein